MACFHGSYKFWPKIFIRITCMNQSSSQAVFYLPPFNRFYTPFWETLGRGTFQKNLSRPLDLWFCVIYDFRQPVPGIIISSFRISISWKPKSSRFLINNYAAVISYLWFSTSRIPLNCADWICWPCNVKMLCNRISFAKSDFLNVDIAILQPSQIKSTERKSITILATANLKIFNSGQIFKLGKLISGRD